MICDFCVMTVLNEEDRSNETLFEGKDYFKFLFISCQVLKKYLQSWPGVAVLFCGVY